MNQGKPAGRGYQRQSLRRDVSRLVTRLLDIPCGRDARDVFISLYPRALRRIVRRISYPTPLWNESVTPVLRMDGPLT
jgi:hypothetical protein